MERNHADRTDLIGNMLGPVGMPPGEMCAILEAADPEIRARYLELHRERLREGLDEQLRSLSVLGSLLVRRGDQHVRR